MHSVSVRQSRVVNVRLFVWLVGVCCEALFDGDLDQSSLISCDYWFICLWFFGCFVRCFLGILQDYFDFSEDVITFLFDRTFGWRFCFCLCLLVFCLFVCMVACCLGPVPCLLSCLLSLCFARFFCNIMFTTFLTCQLSCFLVCLCVIYGHACLFRYLLACISVHLLSCLFVCLLVRCRCRCC